MRLFVLLCLLTACAGEPPPPPIVAVTPETPDDADEPEVEPEPPAKKPQPAKVEPPPKTKPPELPRPPQTPDPTPEPTPPPTVTAASKPAKKPAPKDPYVEIRARALASLRVPFVAEQRIRYTTKEDVKETNAVLTVYPGRAYRLKVTGPLGIVALDVQVRCGKFSYHVPLKLKHLRGPLAQAIKEVPYFPMAALFSIFDPTVEGKWKGRYFDAKRERLKAKVHKTLPAFVEWSVVDGNEQPIVLTISAFMPFEDGALLPQKMLFDFLDGRTIQLEASTINRTPGPEDEVIDAITCD